MSNAQYAWCQCSVVSYQRLKSMVLIACGELPMLEPEGVGWICCGVECRGGRVGRCDMGVVFVNRIVG